MRSYFNGLLAIQIDDTRGVYPLTVDPVLSGPAWTAETDQAGAYFGYSVASAGDVNADNYSDVIVGAPLYDNDQTDEGRVFVYLGSASGLAGSAAWTAESDQVNAWFGSSVATAGDVNGDGYSDVIVGASNYDNTQIDQGRVFVYLGSATGLAGSAAWTAESNQFNAQFGLCVATAGDVNGDDFGDVIIGTPYGSNFGQQGTASVYLGSAAGLDASPAWVAIGDQLSDFFGYSVATAGDINGDGYSEVIVGAYLHDNGQSNEGRAFVYLGSAAGLAASAAWTAECDQVDGFFGFSGATAGDVNGDAFDDVIIGAVAYDNAQPTQGRTFVYLGSAAGLAMTASWTAEWDLPSIGEFARCVGTAGDVDGDGYDDVIIGTSWNGAALYLGSASGLATSAFWTAQIDQAFVFFGFSAATAGDVNGDGFSDLIVGAHYYDNGQPDGGRAMVYMGPGLSLVSSAFCFGDGTLSTACPCSPPNTVPSPSAAPGHGCANSQNLGGALMSAAGRTTPDTVKFTVFISPIYVGYGLLLKGDAEVPGGIASDDGIRCVDGQVIRFGAHYAATNGAPQGYWTYPNSMQTNPVSAQTAQPPGQTAYYQLYYRNTFANFCTAATTNWSNGIQIAWPLP